MKLISCHIENFGKLKDLSYYFEDDLNVLFAENGWGKSTFAAFLRVMFYGFDGENRRNEDGNERLRYRPWGGGVYGGSVTWSNGSKTYRMLRTFGARKKDDIFSLFDNDTGLPSGDYTERTGEELFGIDRDSFCRTVFWSQSDHETSATTSIQAKIGDLSAQQDDLPAYDAAVKRLRKEMDRLRPDRASGLIRKKEERLAVLEADAARLPALTAQLENCSALEPELTAQLEGIRLQKQQYALSVPKDPEEAAARMRREASEKKLETVRLRLRASERKLDALSKDRRRTILRGQKEREQYLELRRELRREIADTVRLQKKQRSVKRTASAAGLLVSLFLFVLCFTGLLPAPFLAVPVLVLILSCAVFWLSSAPADSEPQTEEILRLRKEEESYEASLHSLQDRLHHTDGQIRGEKQRCEDLRKKLREAQDALPSENASVGDGRLPDEIAKALSDFDTREEECRISLRDVRRQEEELRASIRECQTSQDSLPALRSEIAALREQYDICAKTLSYLEEARNTFTSRYMSPFLRSFRRYYGMLTGQSAESIQTDADFSIAVMDEGQPRDPSLMSEGTQDLISFCRRMAMIDAMYPGEKPFLVLDDPFSNLDDERLKGGLRFLHSASLEYQIIYLTCHKSRF